MQYFKSVHNLLLRICVECFLEFCIGIVFFSDPSLFYYLGEWYMLGCSFIHWKDFIILLFDKIPLVLSSIHSKELVPGYFGSGEIYKFVQLPTQCFSNSNISIFCNDISQNLYCRSGIDYFYSIAYPWFGVIGIFTVMIVGSIISFLTGKVYVCLYCKTSKKMHCTIGKEKNEQGKQIPPTSLKHDLENH